jgi:hypothetical protein
MDDDDQNTFVTKRDTANLQEILPDAPSAFEVVFEHVTHNRASNAGDAFMPEGEAGAHRALHLWTKNRVYRIDTTLTCVEVFDRTTGTNDLKHPMIGTQLMGGRRQYGKTMHWTRPYPVPGTEAVFVRKNQLSTPKFTSRIERVVLHVRVTTLVLNDDNAFEEVTNALLLPPKGRGV